MLHTQLNRSLSSELPTVPLSDEHFELFGEISSISQGMIVYHVQTHTHMCAHTQALIHSRYKHTVASSETCLSAW